MALQYISHSDATERQARITRVQQSLEPGFIEKDVHHPRISHDVNKGKGHVFNFHDHDRLQKRACRTGEGQALSEPVGDLRIVLASGVNDQEASSSTSPLGPTVFRVGSYSGNLSTESRFDGKKSRRRPQKWKRLRNPEKVCTSGPRPQTGDYSLLPDTRHHDDLALGTTLSKHARYGTWDVARVRHLFVEEDANHILGMKLDHRREDTLPAADL
ncbi:hypothetical protein HID58_057623 [Brassica napus]|uniref:Uncharacterized protein n=1 Tax=Brassica napus TaxID=3708 RepID=A0ABQ8ARL4_BRANA|nr:hypothetical protein HID58_057623 [Brassica napus]